MKIFDKIAIICYHYIKFMKTTRKIKEKVKKISISSSKTKFKAKEPDAITRISFYLAISDMTQNAKESWAVLLPHMSKAQQERLANVLEAYFLDAATKSIDEKFEKELKQIVGTYTNTANTVATSAPVLKSVWLTGENNTGKHLTAEQQVKLLKVLKEYFQHRVWSIRREQYSAVAKVIECLDKKRAEELLRSIKS